MFVLTVYEIGGISRVVNNLLDCLLADKQDLVLLVEGFLDKHYTIDEHIKLINLDISSKRGFFAKIFDGFDVGEIIADAGFFPVFGIVGTDRRWLLPLLDEITVGDEYADGEQGYHCRTPVKVQQRARHDDDLKK